MDLRRLDIPEACEIVPARHGDERGYFAELFRDRWFRENVADLSFVQENQSLSSAAGTVRGLHFQSDPFVQGKLVRCVRGAIFDVAVDMRKGSPSYGRWVAVELTEERCNQIWVPPGFAHGFCSLVPDCVVAYKVTAYYSRENDHGFAWDDPDVGVEWPDVAAPGLLSAKDRDAPRLRDLPTYFAYED